MISVSEGGHSKIDTFYCLVQVNKFQTNYNILGCFRYQILRYLTVRGTFLRAFLWIVNGS